MNDTFKSAMFTIYLLMLLTLATCDFARADSPEVSFHGRRVLLFGIDGVRSDALKLLVENGRAPNIAQLVAEGTVNWAAVSGGWTGNADDPTTTPTVSGPSWASALTGVWKNRHEVTNNSFTVSNFDDYPHFFKRIKELAPGTALSSLVSWPEINDYIVGRSGAADICDIYNFTSGSYDERDSAITDKTVELLETADPDIIFHYQGNTDIAGHSYGFSPASDGYLAAIEVADQRIGRVLAAIRARPDYADEDWLYIVISDHGGIGTGHGGQTPDERLIPFIASGGEIPRGAVTEERTGLVTLPATIFRHLGIPIQQSWQWESDAFQIFPRLRAESGARSVFLSWTEPRDGFAGLTGYEILRDGASVATLPPEQRQWTDESPGDPAQAQVAYQIIPAGSGEAPLLAVAAMPGYTPPAPPLLELHAYLPLDGDLAGALGTGVDGSAIGANAAEPRFVAGKFGQAAAFANSNLDTVPPNDWAVSLGNLDTLYAQSFSLSLWLRWTGTPLASVDKAIIGNSNWYSGENTGWLISSLGNGREGKIKTVSGSRLNQQILWNDGNWNHVVLSYDRVNSRAYWYMNGNLLNPGGTAIDSGSLAAGLPTMIGGSGNGNYAANFSEVDDVALFSGVMQADVVAYLYNGGAGRTADSYADAPGNASSAYRDWIEGLAAGHESIADEDLEPLADPNANGIPNLLEFALGGEPFAIGAQAPRLEIFRAAAGGFRLMFPQRNGGSGVHGEIAAYSADGIEYRLLTAPSPVGPWLASTGSVVQRDAESYAEGDWHCIVLELPGIDNSSFFRLDVSLSD